MSLGMGALPGPGIKPVSPVLADRFFNTELPEKLQDHTVLITVALKKLLKYR